MTCPRCSDRSIIYKSALGAWFVGLGEETLQITYCPECGKLLDNVAGKVDEMIARAEKVLVRGCEALRDILAEPRHAAFHDAVQAVVTAADRLLAACAAAKKKAKP